jgi:hypothetical protein
MLLANLFLSFGILGCCLRWICGCKVWVISNEQCLVGQPQIIILSSKACSQYLMSNLHLPWVLGELCIFDRSVGIMSPAPHLLPLCLLLVFGI